MEMVTSARVDEALARLKGLFLEVPTTMLSVEGACDLTELDAATCLSLLLALEQARFLCRTPAGQFLLGASSARMDS
jgi:DNA-binding IclR family transcriptional regulator